MNFNNRQYGGPLAQGCPSTVHRSRRGFANGRRRLLWPQQFYEGGVRRTPGPKALGRSRTSALGDWNPLRPNGFPDCLHRALAPQGCLTWGRPFPGGRPTTCRYTGRARRRTEARTVRRDRLFPREGPPFQNRLSDCIQIALAWPSGSSRPPTRSLASMRDPSQTSIGLFKPNQRWLRPPLHTHLIKKCYALVGLRCL